MQRCTVAPQHAILEPDHWHVIIHMPSHSVHPRLGQESVQQAFWHLRKGNVYLTEWWPSFRLLCSSTGSIILQSGPIKPWRLYSSILYPGQLLPLIPFAVSPFLSQISSPLPAPSSPLEVSRLPYHSIWQEAGGSHFITHKRTEPRQQTLKTRLHWHT